METDARLVGFLSAYLGEWSGVPGLTVVGSQGRRSPGWDGSVTEIVGVATPEGGVLSVPPELADGVRAAVRSWAEVPSSLPAAVGRPDAKVFSGVFRWTVAPADLAAAGEWVDAT